MVEIDSIYQKNNEFEPSDRKPLVMIFMSDKEAEIRLGVNLRQQGLIVVSSISHGEAEKDMFELRPDTLIIDEVAYWNEGRRWLEERSPVPPIMVLTDSPAASLDKFIGTGAQDAIFESNAYQVIANKVKDVMAEKNSSLDALVKVGNVEIDLVHHKVFTPDGVIDFNNQMSLSRTTPEWKILAQLTINAGRAMDSRELLIKSFGPDHNDQYLRVNVNRLMAKLGPKYKDIIFKPSNSEYILSGPSLKFVPELLSRNRPGATRETAEWRGKDLFPEAERNFRPTFDVVGNEQINDLAIASLTEAGFLFELDNERGSAKEIVMKPEVCVVTDAALIPTVRSESPYVPLLAILTREEVQNGLNLGADVVMSLPINPNMLGLSAKNLIRAKETKAGKPSHIGDDIYVDFVSGAVINSKGITTGGVEAKIIKILLDNPKPPVDLAFIQAQLKLMGNLPYADNIVTYISRIRKKFGTSFIMGNAKKGYNLPWFEQKFQ